MADSPDTFLKCLIDDLSAQDLPSQEEDFWPGISIREAAAVSIRSSLLKKFEFPNTKAADDAAIDKFLRINEMCKDWKVPSCGLKVDETSTITSKEEMLLNGFKSAVYDFSFRRGMPLFDHPYDILAEARLGPGANIGANGGDFYTKLFSSPLTCTDHSMYFWYARYIRGFPEWANAENIRLAQYGEARVVPGNKLSLVPKNDEISRCICTEPTLNTFFQLGLGAHLERRLKERFAIDLEDQQFKNRDLARLGSITDGLSTIDLSSASDSMSLNMLRWCLPTYLFRSLIKYRCPKTAIKGRGVVDLHMISTMGNGYTFPLQTMLFACAVAACYNFRGIPLDSNTSDTLWGVNGDDIICPRSVTEDVILLLRLLGFSVNSDKTFVEGPFRESCGADFFLGTNIRGVYIKSLSTLQDLYSAINRLMRFSTRHAIDLRRTLKFLFDLVGRKRLLFVPPWSNLDAGIHSSLAIARPFIKRDLDIQGYRYSSYEDRSSSIRVCSQRLVVPVRDRRRIYNPSGLLISFLQGSISSSKAVLENPLEGYVSYRHVATIGTRKGTHLWKKRRRSASVWIPFVSPKRDYYDYALDWRRWESDSNEIYQEIIGLRA